MGSEVQIWSPVSSHKFRCIAPNEYYVPLPPWALKIYCMGLRVYIKITLFPLMSNAVVSVPPSSGRQMTTIGYMVDGHKEFRGHDHMGPYISGGSPDWQCVKG